MGFCRFYTWFACLSTIYTKNLRKIYFYMKSLKSTIFVKKTFIFIMFNILPSNMVKRSVNLKSVNHSCKKSFYEEYINVQPILRQILGRQIYNLSTLSVYNLHIFNAQKTVQFTLHISSNLQSKFSMPPPFEVENVQAKNISFILIVNFLRKFCT